MHVVAGPSIPVRASSSGLCDLPTLLKLCALPPLHLENEDKSLL